MSEKTSESTNLLPVQEKANYILEHIDLSLKNMLRHRKENRTWASVIKILVIFLSSALTVLLGLQSTGLEKYFKDIAFTLAAVVTLLNTLEPFFNFRALWVEHEQAIARMYRLKNDVEFYLAGTPPKEIKVEKLDDFLEKFKDIWNSLNDNYIRHRKGSTM